MAACVCLQLPDVLFLHFFDCGCRLRGSNDISELLGLGPSGFRPELLDYLRAYPSLLWQAQVAAGMFSEAGTTLMVAAEAEKVRNNHVLTSVACTCYDHVHVNVADICTIMFCVFYMHYCTVVE